jgi:hypothetical protein
MNKSTLAKLCGYTQLAITYLNQVLSANGGLIPTAIEGWLKLLASLLLAFAIHHASNTSATIPNGIKSTT